MRLPAYLFAVAILVGCAAAPVKDDRPLPVDDPEAYGIVYLVKASSSDLLKVSSDQLRKRYGRSFIEMGETGYGTPYWHLSTDYREYKLNGKRYRSQCAVHCFPYRQFPQYVCFSVSCKLEQHDLRSTFHGGPSWGWHQEQGLHLAHEVITDIVRVAHLTERDLIRLRRRLSHEEEIKRIEAHESNQPRVEPDERKAAHHERQAASRAMSWKTEAQKIYEARVVADSLTRLAKRFELKSLPFSDGELQILATRARESFRSEKKRERLDRYKAHLSTLYGEERVATISAALQDINNEIGYEEK